MRIDISNECDIFKNNLNCNAIRIEENMEGELLTVLGTESWFIIYCPFCGHKIEIIEDSENASKD